jgi:xanthine dehydrogenase accessory factor
MHDQIPEQALAWHRSGMRAALATVVETWGSAPRRVGAQLAVSGRGEIAGSVSGGCVEGAVVVEALEALEDGAPRLLEFGVTNDEAFAVGLACGGRIRVLVEPVGSALSEEMLAQIVAAREAGEAYAYLVNTETWQRTLDPDVAGISREAIAARHRADRAGFEGAWFVAIGNPPLKLVVVGAVHIAQDLLKIAEVAGYDCTLIDPRETFGSATRFPGQKVIDAWPDEALRALKLDHRTAVVTLTHDPKLDDPAILAALESDIFYIGCLGSTRTHAKRVARLEEAGISPTQIARIHAPVGLDLGAATPAEIAIATMAEITQTLRRER